MASTYNVYFEEKKYTSLKEYLNKTVYSSIFILVDEHTKSQCLPVFLSKIQAKTDYRIISITSGEKNKTLETCTYVWQKLTNFNADRKSILINLGGGMLTDLGGFTAATFKRGIRFINVPTTLLGMVDASIGGKTGIDFNYLKNQIGLFSNPELIIIDYSYLKTLPKRELNSGMAEIIKYALTYDKSLWISIINNRELTIKNLKIWIYKSIEIKTEIVKKDPTEQSLRKILNYGHTIGHAIESYFLNATHLKTLTHGEAIAIGLIIETYISFKQLHFPEKELKALRELIHVIFDKESLLKSYYPAFFELMKQDKKNNNGIVFFTLMEDIAKYKINCTVDKTLIEEAINFYNA
ncbi:MAG: 3-dehydroquinate synthase [Flavobacteriaceae bacterium]|nr:3-dehydroquinate synthase [Flavobacteriaceae bacterium]